MRHLATLTCAAGALAMSPALGQDEDPTYYVKGTLGAVLMGDSSNSGRATEPFEPGLIDDVLVDGGAYVFDTKFEVGTFVSGAVGKSSRFGPFRSEIELIYTRAGAKEHDDLRTLGRDLADVDAAVLLGGDEPVGINTGRVLEDAKGVVNTYSLMVNFYHDVRRFGGPAYPYWGVGVGGTYVGVDYTPSNLDFVDDGTFAFGYQAMAGFAYDFDDRGTLHTGFRYLGTTEVEVDADALVPSNLTVDIDQFVTEIGWRMSF